MFFLTVIASFSIVYLVRFNLNNKRRLLNAYVNTCIHLYVSMFTKEDCATIQAEKNFVFKKLFLKIVFKN